jgi:hypothetical protein
MIRLLRLAFLLIVGLAIVRPADAAQLAFADSAPFVFAPPGATVPVSVSGGPANRYDWVGLFSVIAPDINAAVTWKYLNGSQTPPSSGVASASLTFAAPQTPGLYEVRFFRNNGYQRLAVAGPIVVPVQEHRVFVNDESFPTVVPATAGTSVAIDVINGPGNPRDWVGMYAIGAANSPSLAWMYMDGTQTPPSAGVFSAHLTFTLPLTGGAYEFRWFQNDGYTLLAKSTIVDVAAPAKVTINGVDPPTSVTVLPSSSVTIGVSGGPANTTDWVGLYQPSTADPYWIAKQYLNGLSTPPTTGVSAAQLTFTAPSNAGTYELRFFAADTYGRLATSASLVVASASPLLTVNGISPPHVLAAAPSGSASVQVSNGPGNTHDWVAMAATTAPNTTYLDWKYLNGLTTAPSQGLTSATLGFTLPASAGTYEFRLFANNGYGRLATSSPISVASSTVSVSLIAPTPSASFNAPSTITLSASASANGRTITQVAFYSGSTHLGTDTTSPYSIAWSSPSHGSHSLTAVATDNTSATTTSSAVNITVTGMLATPTASPAGGFYQPNQTVTISGPSGAQVRYTTDGTVPTSTSTLYTSALTLTQITVIKARAFQSGWLTSPTMVESYATDNAGPTIAPTITPRPNSDGWNNTPVTITFVCTDPAGVASCPTYQTVSAEGASQSSNVSATDALGNVTNLTVTVNLDFTSRPCRSAHPRTSRRPARARPP